VALLDRVAAALPGAEKRSSIDTWISDYLIPSQGSFSYGNTSYPFGGVNTLYGTQRAQEVTQTLPGFAAALRRCPPAFAAEMVRAGVLSQARFTFRRRRSSPTPRQTFGNQSLSVLERPWPNATTGELVTRMEWHAGVAGNAFVTNFTPGRLRVLRPDWTIIVYGSQREPDDPALAIDGEVIGYVYQNGGIYSSTGTKPIILSPREVAHWSPIPDPEHAGIGMSWVTPAIREIQGDQLATAHKIRFFENGATPNLVVKGIQAADKTEFDAIVEMMDDAHAGVANAYKTLYLTAGADAAVVGADLSQIDFKAVQGAGETRLSMLSRVHPVILGSAEGLSGSSLNAGNFGMARRIWADTWVYPTLQDICQALAPLVDVPSDAELWYDTADMPILREDAKDAADIAQTNAVTITTYVKDGFTPESAVAATIGRDESLLEHSGMVSVQLQPPGTPAAPSNGRPASGLIPGRAADDATDDEVRQALAEVRYDTSPIGMGKNWVSGVGGLPAFIRAIAHALIRDGHPESQAIQMAVGVVKNWASGQGHVSPKTRAKAAAAVAEWEAKKAASHAK
jgi:phage portal protein BeeE